MDKFAQHYVDCLKVAFRPNLPLLRGIGGAAAGGAAGYQLSKAQGYDPLATTTSIMLNAATGAEVANHPGKLMDPKFLTMAAGKEIVPQAVTFLHSAANTTDRVGNALPDLSGMTLPSMPAALKNPYVTAGIVGTGALAVGGAGLYALIQAARAAKRLGDGHAIRLSTSLRKRPGQSTDLNLGFSQMAPGRLGRGGRRTADSQDGPVDEGSPED